MAVVLDRAEDKFREAALAPDEQQALIRSAEERLEEMSVAEMEQVSQELGALSPAQLKGAAASLKAKGAAMDAGGSFSEVEGMYDELQRQEEEQLQKREQERRKVEEKLRQRWAIDDSNPPDSGEVRQEVEDQDDSASSSLLSSGIVRAKQTSPPLQ